MENTYRLPLTGDQITAKLSLLEGDSNAVEINAKKISALATTKSTDSVLTLATKGYVDTQKEELETRVTALEESSIASTNIEALKARVTALEEEDNTTSIAIEALDTRVTALENDDNSDILNNFTDAITSLETRVTSTEEAAGGLVERVTAYNTQECNLDRHWRIW